MHIEEGKIRLRNGYRVWCRRVGMGGGIPLLVLHGGPGAGHDYLEPLEQLSVDRPVILYDQLGCGRSDQPEDRSLWSMERFVSELAEVRNALGLREIILFGQSSGGMLAIDYMLTHPSGVIGLILADTCASMPQLEQEVKRLKSQLSPETIATLDRCEINADYQKPEYKATVAEFYKRHVCRLSVLPDCLNRTAANLKNSAVYETMNGPNELVITGNLKDWNRINRLSEIKTPTLVLVGRYGQVAPACSETLHQGLANCELAIFEESAHIPHIEEEEKYPSIVSCFMSRLDRRR